MNIKTTLSLLAVSTALLSASPTEDTLKDIFEGDFICKNTSCISNNISSEDEKSRVNIEKTIIFFTKKPENIIFDKSKFKELAKIECSKDLTVTDMDNCLIQKENNIQMKERKNVTDLIKEISFNKIYIENKKDNLENISVGSVIIKKKGKISLDKNVIKHLTIDDLIINSSVDIKNIKVDKSAAKIKAYELIENLFQSKKLDITYMNNFKFMYKEIINSFFNKNDLEKDFYLGLETKKIGNNLDIDLILNSNTKELGSVKGSILFSIENIDKSLELYNISMQSKEQGLTGLLALTQNLLLKEINLSVIESEIRSIHNELLSTNKEYKKNYKDLIQKIEVRHTTNTIENFFEKTFSLSQETTSLKIENTNRLKAMMLFMSFGSPDFEKLLTVTTEYK